MDIQKSKTEVMETFVNGLGGDGHRFVPEVTITEGDLGVVHGHRHAADVHGTAVSWRETHLCRFDGRLVAQHWPHIPAEKAAALLAGTNPPLTPIPVSFKARFIARAVGVVARVLPAADFRNESPVDASRQLVAAYVERFKNQQQFQVFPKYFSPTFRHHFDFDGQPDTASSFVNVGVNLLAGFPDVHVELIHLIAQDDLVVEHNLVTATHKGTWAGQPATGRAVTWNEAHIYRINKQRIVENWPTVNFDNLFLQLR